MGNTCDCQGQNFTSTSMANQADIGWTLFPKRLLNLGSLFSQISWNCHNLQFQEHIDTSAFHLYAFADASTKAYSAVVYICRNQETSLVMSQSHVAPIKTIILPKLELTTAVMATRLTQFIVSSLHLQSNNQTNYFHLWTLLFTGYTSSTVLSPSSHTVWQRS